jgi:NTP pyrophosphatase (non-canonical NTP hydrolase)
MIMTLNELRDKIHKNAVKHGFYNEEASAMSAAGGNEQTVAGIKHAFFTQRIALIHSEVSEALEADRKAKYSEPFDRFVWFDDWDEGEKSFDRFNFNNYFKGTTEDELADVIIRTLDLCGHLGIDIERHIELKMKYNESREYKHGKNY